MFKKLSTATLALIIGANIGSAAEIRDGGVLLIEKFQGTYLAFERESWPKGAHGVMIMVNGPEKYEASVGTKGEVPQINLAKHGDLEDGKYSYVITGGTGEVVQLKEKLNNGREKPTTAVAVAFSVGGSFVVDGGKIIGFAQGEEKGSEKPVEDPNDGKDGDEGGESEKPNPGKDEDDTDRGNK